MRTGEVAAAANCSVQQVRDLEALGVIPASRRGPQGYREFAPEHCRALEAYRLLAFAVGPVEARQSMRRLQELPFAEAVASLARFHGGLCAERDEALAAIEALAMIKAEAVTDEPPTSNDVMTVSEVATAVGVRTSALRFWEREGLIAPTRRRSRRGRERSFDPACVRDVRIVVALRAGGYRIPDVRSAMRAVHGLGTSQDLTQALEERLSDIAKRMAALLQADALLLELVASEPA